MNKEICRRMKMAGKYQRMAVSALLPQNIAGHLDVIEKEIKAMVLEITADVRKGCKRDNTCEEVPDDVKPSGVKKVDIL